MQDSCRSRPGGESALVLDVFVLPMIGCHRICRLQAGSYDGYHISGNAGQMYEPPWRRIGAQ
jgi:hypothetical protein